MIDLNAHMEAYHLIRNLPECTIAIGMAPDAFGDFRLEQAVEEVACRLDRFGLPDFRINFIAALLTELGADNRELVEEVALAAAYLTAPDYFGLRVTDVDYKIEHLPDEDAA